MDVCTNIKDINKFDQSNLTIGSFDGMHIGHMKIIKELKNISRINNLPTVAITFDPLPKTVLNKNKPGNLKVLINIEKKLEIFDNNGIDYVWIVPFNDDFAKITAKQFLENYLINYFKPIDIVLGYDHHFGYKKKGGVQFLRSMKEKYNYNIIEIDPIEFNNTIVSSTKIRDYLKVGDIASANNLLGWEYSLSGTIVKGQGRGKMIDFPTANVKPYNDNQLIPSKGVYRVDTKVGNCNYIGMCNIGNRPTFYDLDEEVIEVHLITDQVLSIYDKNILIKFKDFIREEKKYDNAAELVNQLKRDRYTCLPN